MSLDGSVRSDGAATTSTVVPKEDGLDEEFRLFVSRAFERRFRKRSWNKDDDDDGRVRPTPVQSEAWSILSSVDGRDGDERGRRNDRIDLVAVAPTASGKTLAYGLPLLRRSTRGEHDGDGAASTTTPRLRGLVLVPTRELAAQVAKELNRCVDGRRRRTDGGENVVVAAVYGGTKDLSRSEQIASLSSVRALVATPGRLLDLLGAERAKNGNDENENEKETKDVLRLTHVDFVVIDEADRMLLQMGMADQVRNVLKKCPNFQRRGDDDDDDATTGKGSGTTTTLCLFSATFPDALAAVCETTLRMRNPRTVRVSTSAFSSRGRASKKTSDDDDGDGDGGGVDVRRPTTELASVPSHVTQILHVCASHKKPKKLLTTLEKARKRSNSASSGNNRRASLTIVFFRTIKVLKHISRLLSAGEYKCAEFHGQMPQEQRERVLHSFKAGKILILLATDCAARGIHVKNVETVVNYDFPSSLEQYVHRCGRAGREGSASGAARSAAVVAATVYSFFHRELAPMAPDVLSLLRSSDSWIDPNLSALVDSSKDDEDDDDARRREETTGDETNRPSSKKKKRRRRGGAKSRAKRERTINDDTANAETALRGSDDDDDDDDEFAALSGSKIVLKRAGHVSEAEESSDEDDQ